jgi:hypothetical protein
MIKKIALLVALAFSLAAVAAADQYPLPPGGGGGNIVLK